jgi:methyl-accepting chemotaxis protein
VSSNIRFWSLTALFLACLTGLGAWGVSQVLLERYTQAVGQRLELLNELRRGALDQYLSTAEAELNFWGTNLDILAAQEKFNQLWQQQADQPAALASLRQFYVQDNPFPEGEYRKLDDAGDGSEYSRVHSALHPMSKLFVTVRGYYDVFLIGVDGDVFYSVEKEADFATNLNSGEWSNTALARVFQRAVSDSEPQAVFVSDMEPYSPSGDAPAIFMASALRGSTGEVLGVIAFQLPTSHILSIMNYTSGMGETGETYLVGQDHLMRSDSRFTEVTAILKQTVETATADKALLGGQGVEFVTDYRGVEVLSAYTNYQIGLTSWAVMAEIDRDEILKDAAQDRPNLAGIMLFFYGLSLWSVWYWRGRPSAEEHSAFAELGLEVDSSEMSSG